MARKTRSNPFEGPRDHTRSKAAKQRTINRKRQRALKAQVRYAR